MAEADRLSVSQTGLKQRGREGRRFSSVFELPDSDGNEENDGSKGKDSSTENSATLQQGPPILLKELPTPPPRAINKYNLFRRHIEYEEQPRQVLAIFVAIIPFIYITFFAPSAPLEMPDFSFLKPYRSTVFYSVMAFVWILVVFSSTQFPDSLMVRPFPLVWRVVQAISLIYIIALAVLLVHDLGTIRAFLVAMFDDVKPPEAEVWNMQKDCSINSRTIYRQLTSIWFQSHAFGWMVKMTFLRDWRICMAQSLLFELVECSLQFLIPDFRECWWDSIFIDALGANVVGMAVGWAALGLLNKWFAVVRQYNWSGKEGKETKHRWFTFKWFRTCLWRLLPMSWPDYHWGAFTSFSRFMMNVPMVLGPVFLETSIFFFMQYFWLPPTNALILFRMGMICAISFPGVAEWYQYATNPEVKRMGGSSWLMWLIMAFEALVCIKFGRVVFPEFTIPVDIWAPWVAFAVLFGLWLLLFFGLKKSPSSPQHADEAAQHGASPGKKKPLWKSHWLDFLFFLSFAPLLLLCRLWAWK